MDESKLQSLFAQRFPLKLWNIVNECDSGAVAWGSEGLSIEFNYETFQEEYLNTGVFRTSNIASFVRQMNLYSFWKVKRCGNGIHEFKHPYFVKNRKDLVQFIHRRTGVRLSKEKITKQKQMKTKNIKIAVEKGENEGHQSSTNMSSLTAPTDDASNHPFSYLEYMAALSSVWNPYLCPFSIWSNPASFPAMQFAMTSGLDQVQKADSVQEDNPEWNSKMEDSDPDGSGNEKGQKSAPAKVVSAGKHPAYMLVVPGFYSQSHAPQPNHGFSKGLTAPTASSAICE